MGKTSIGEIVFVVFWLLIITAFIQFWYFFIPVAVAYFVYRIYAISPFRKEKAAKEACWELYEKAKSIVGTPQDYEAQMLEFAQPVANSITKVPDCLANEILFGVMDLYEQEPYSIARVSEPPTVCNSLEGARYRDHLNEVVAKHNSRLADRELAQGTIKNAVQGFLRNIPDFEIGEGDLVGEVPVSDTCDIRQAVLELYLGFYKHPVVSANLFSELREQLGRNMCEASGLPYTHENVRYEATSVVDYAGADPVKAYLAHTPLLQICQARLPYRIPQKLRFEHQWVIAPTGSGKTNLLCSQLDRDFDRVARGEASVIVMESKRDLIKGIEGLDRFGPGGDLEGRLVLIDVEDNQYPVALNLFDLAAHDNSEELSFRDAEIMKNSTQSMLEYIFRSLIDAKLTSLQSTLLRFSTELMLQMPGATLEDLTDLFENPDGLDRYEKYLPKLSKDAQGFFATKFSSSSFGKTKSEVLNRIYGVKSIGTLARMFAAPKTKLNMYEEMGSGKVILINTCKALMQKEGAELFGRFMIALTLLAAEKRQLQPRSERLPTFFYIDECQDYIRTDETLPVILAQARALNLGMVLAHQNLSQINTEVQSALLSNTSIKYASHLAEGTSSIASSMRTEPSFIIEQPKFAFAAFYRDVTDRAISLRVPETDFEKFPRMSPEAHALIRDRMRAEYCYKLDMKPDDDPVDDSTASDDSKPNGSSPPRDDEIDGDWNRDD